MGDYRGSWRGRREGEGLRRGFCIASWYGDIRCVIEKMASKGVMGDRKAMWELYHLHLTVSHLAISL